MKSVTQLEPQPVKLKLYSQIKQFNTIPTIRRFDHYHPCNTLMSQWILQHSWPAVHFLSTNYYNNAGITICWL